MPFPGQNHTTTGAPPTRGAPPPRGTPPARNTVTLPADIEVVIDGQWQKGVPHTQILGMPDDTWVCTDNEEILLGQLKSRLIGSNAPTRPNTGFSQGQQQGRTQGRQSMFAGVSSSDFVHRTPFLRPGEYILRIAHMELKEARDGRNMVIVEVDVIESKHQMIDGEACNAEGTRAAIFLKQNDSFKGNMKELCWALRGLDANGQPYDPSDPSIGSEEECKAYVYQDQAVGIYIQTTASNVQTNNGGNYTRCSHFPLGVLPNGEYDPNTVR